MNLRPLLFWFASMAFLAACNPEIANGIRRNDLRRDVLMVTTEGSLVIRLSDSTPLHRNNFIRLVKSHFYDSILFHRVIQGFMIQAGDPESRHARAGRRLGNGGPGYTIPAEFRASLFHRRGALGAARTGDAVNPQKASSGSQFYIVQGRKFTGQSLDSVETYRLGGRKIPEAWREVYQTEGGAPHLDQNYTVFGQVIKGMEVVDRIAAVPTSGPSGSNRPLRDCRILSVKLIKRK